MLFTAHSLQVDCRLFTGYLQVISNIHCCFRSISTVREKRKRDRQKDRTTDGWMDRPSGWSIKLRVMNDTYLMTRNLILRQKYCVLPLNSRTRHLLLCKRPYHEIDQKLWDIYDGDTLDRTFEVSKDWKESKFKALSNL